MNVDDGTFPPFAAVQRTPLTEVVQGVWLSSVIIGSHRRETAPSGVGAALREQFCNAKRRQLPHIEILPAARYDI